MLLNDPISYVTVSTQRQLEEVKKFLHQENLPTSDLELNSSSLIRFSINDNLVGTGGLQTSDSHLLLRSIAVDSRYRKLGIGKKIISTLEHEAISKDFKEVFLMTEIPHYFKKLDYQPIDRNEAPGDIKDTEEFKYLCPESATIMIKSLQ